jgi:hypothetical protein
MLQDFTSCVFYRKGMTEVGAQVTANLIRIVLAVRHAQVM